jgi:hypothetical protein
VEELESLCAIGFFNFLSDDVNNLFDDFSTFGVVPFGPVVTSAGLSKYEVVGAEELAERSLHRRR